MSIPYVATAIEDCHRHGCQRPIRPGEKAVWSRVDGWNYHEECSPDKLRNPKLTICPPANAEGAEEFPQTVTNYSGRHLAVDEDYARHHKKGLGV